MTVPYTFGTATTSIPLSNLDANFNTPITLGNTSIYLGNTTTTIGNLTLTNATISSGNVTLTNVSVTTANVTNITVTGTANIATGNVATLTSTSITDSGLTSGRVTYAGTAGLLQDDADFTFNGTTVTMANDASISGLTVGRGASAVATNTAVGASALVANTSGDFATAVGSEAGFKNTTGRFLVAVGRQAGYNNLTGGSNTAVGESAFFTNSVGDNNTAIGQAALYTNTASQNTAVGSSALLLNSSGTANSALGYQAGYTNIIGTNIVAFGQGALYTNNADDNTAVGRRAGFLNSSGIANAFFGTDSGYSTTSTGNSFFGSGSGNAVTSGAKNSILGQYSGNQGGLDIRTASNYIVLSNGDGNPRGIFDGSGNFLVGKTAVDVTVAGTQIESTGTVGIVRNGAVCLIANRLTDDGTLVSLRQDSTEEGTISVSGTTVSYNGGHLSRWAQMLTKPELFKGTVMSNLDEMNVYTKDGQPVDNEQLNKVKVSDTEGDANVAGVFVNWTHDEDHNVDEINMAMTGDMIIRIAQGVTVVRGDLLMSAGDGTAKPQGDDIIRSKTVAKVTSNHVTCTYADGSYCVPCVLMAC